LTTKERYKKIIEWFQVNMPVAETELHHSNPYELLVAVILSAQCTDKRVNMITPALFEAFPTPEVMAASSHEVVFDYIRSISYPNNKAKHLVGMAQKLVSDFGGGFRASCYNALPKESVQALIDCMQEFEKLH
jgi:endonuclease-3